MSKYEVVRPGKTHGLSGGTHVWTVGQVLDARDYTPTTISHLLEHGLIVPQVKAAGKKAGREQEAEDAGS